MLGLWHLFQQLAATSVRKATDVFLSAFIVYVSGSPKLVRQLLPTVEFYLYPTVGTVLIHSVKPELTE